MKPLKTFTVGKITAQVFPDKRSLSAAAAADAAADIAAVQKEKMWANLVFSTGASQFDFVESIKEAKGFDWGKVRAFHLDEYVGMSPDHPASFRRFLRERLVDFVHPGEVYYLNADAPDVEAECRRYEALLRQYPIDIGFIGIGENGHIAFNDPPVADFSDPVWVKRVKLDEKCRRQQLGEGWFPTLDAVPREALSQTCTGLMAYRRVYLIVPERRKAEAVHDALCGPIATSCPASIMREHPACRLYLDVESASLLPQIK
ncbi:glucosamine-6-phosphate deaminase [bacterium]|nr:glucosamine-6-phosphate deaminase [bacterium]